MDELEKTAGLEKLAEALAWLTSQELEGDVGGIQVFLTNFYVSCKNPGPRDYLKFLSHIRDYEQADQNKLCDAFFKAYDLPENHFDLILKS